MIRQMMQALGSLLFPLDVRCSLCASEQGMGDGFGLCQNCSASLPCSDAPRRIPSLTCWSAFYYQEPVPELVQRLKYNGQRYLAYTLGSYMALKASECISDVHAVWPVPLHSRRQRQRGFNQSELLGRVVAEALGVPIESDGLLRIRNTQQQAQLSAAQRLENVHRAFTVHRKAQGRHILLVDDVLTTGATLCACAEVILQAGGLATALVAAAADSHTYQGNCASS